MQAGEQHSPAPAQAVPSGEHTGPVVDGDPVVSDPPVDSPESPVELLELELLELELLLRSEVELDPVPL